MTTLTQPEIDRIVYMSRIAVHTNDSNREYHHAMLDAGWMPIVGTVGIQRWLNRTMQTSMSYDAASDFYAEYGEAPAPF